MSTAANRSAQPDNSNLKRYLLPLILLSIGICCLVAALLVPINRKSRPAPAAESNEIRFPIPEFALTERSGATITKEALLGKVWVASFVFTRCTGPCPSVSATMARLQNDLKLAERDDFRLVTFTVDPGRDGVKELQTYAQNFQAHPQRWLFLTGEEQAIHQLMTKGFMLGVKRSAQPQPIEGQEFDHSTLVAVVDKQGVARGYFDGYQGPNDEGGEKYKARYQEMLALIATLEQE